MVWGPLPGAEGSQERGRGSPGYVVLAEDAQTVLPTAFPQGFPKHSTASRSVPVASWSSRSVEEQVLARVLRFAERRLGASDGAWTVQS